MGVLDVVIHGTRHRITCIGNAIETHLDAIDDAGKHLVTILIEEAEAEYSKGVGIGDQLLHDQIVVLTGFDKRAVLADRVAD